MNFTGELRNMVTVYATARDEEYASMVPRFAVTGPEGRTVALVSDPVAADAMARGLAAHHGCEYFAFPSLDIAILRAYGHEYHAPKA